MVGHNDIDPIIHNSHWNYEESINDSFYHVTSPSIEKKHIALPSSGFAFSTRSALSISSSSIGYYRCVKVYQSINSRWLVMIRYEQLWLASIRLIHTNEYWVTYVYY